MIHNVIRTGVQACCLIDRIAGGRNHGCASPARPLDGIVADTASTAHDQQRLVLDLTIGENGAVSRHCGNAQARAGVETRLFRQARRAITTDCDILCSRSEATFMLCLEHPDTLPFTALVDAFTHRLDNARAVAIRNYETCVQQIGESASALLDVRGVDGAGVHAHEHFTCCGLRCVNVA